MNKLPEILILESVGSTNTYLKELAKEDPTLKEFTTVLALSQTKGRGRMQREWQSKEGETLCMSILLPQKGDSSITLLCALGIYNALKQYIPEGLMIKWPNDILFSNKKLCGILCEGTSGFVVAGIGVNLNSLEFSKDIAHKATSLKLITDQEYSLSEVAVLIQSEIYKTLQDYNFTLTEDAVKLYNSLCANIGKEVKSEKLSGIAKGIDKSGALIIESENKLFTINSGEVFVNGIY